MDRIHESGRRPPLNTDLIHRIQTLCREKNAAILAHNYQIPEIQDLADFVGDSLGLSRIAAESDADILVFCGVHFMAETASILAQGKKILLPDENAGCPMANMVTPRELANLKAKHPDAVVVTYVNSSAAIKAMSDICCTSANAVEVVRSIPRAREILFVPDRNLGAYAARALDRPMILWNGYCPTHERFLVDHLRRTREAHPQARLVMHPEAPLAALDMADAIGSTSGILRYCRESEAREFLIGTEIGMLHRLRKENPDKVFYPASEIADCPNMKLNTLEKVLWCLEDEAPEVRVDPDTAAKAYAPIRKMLEIRPDA